MRNVKAVEVDGTAVFTVVEYLRMKSGAPAGYDPVTIQGRNTLIVVWWKPAVKKSFAA
ncbi:MAG: hypothetical protein WAT61_07095 [Flavobacteriales bacterium]|nr:hypothetical protein [Flavobacteriales bacterium]